MIPLPANRWLVCVPGGTFPPRLENPQFQVTPENLRDLNLIFDIRTERGEEVAKGEFFVYRVTIRSCRSGLLDSERRSHYIELYHGQTYLAGCPVQETEQDGQLSYAFSVAGTIAREPRSVFGFSLLSGFDGHHYWFYLRDFAPPR